MVPRPGDAAGLSARHSPHFVEYSFGARPREELRMHYETLMTEWRSPVNTIAMRFVGGVDHF